jgi:hypothetical protein
MDPHSLRILLGSLAEQQYMFHLLTRTLVEKGILKSGELNEKYSEKERFQFSHDLLDEFVSRGLKIDGNSPSALPPESPSVAQQEDSGEPDPK